MKTVSIGNDEFDSIRSKDCFYMDKTAFIKEWWEAEDKVTLITRPRRFGKTLNMNMLNCFFSTRYAGREELFDGLAIWKDEKYKKIQGTYPVIFLTFADVKANYYEGAVAAIKQNITVLYNQNNFLLKENLLTEKERAQFNAVQFDMDDSIATTAIRFLMEYLNRYYGKKVILLLDEYDTPLQEAYASGYWDEMAAFTRSLFNTAFKTNPYLERAIMTGITRVGKESIFSDLNNLKVVTAISNEYAESFGFTEEEVFAALEEAGIPEKKKEVKAWYDGFTFGECHDIYNPWSITNFLKNRKIAAYWADTSSNALAGTLIASGSPKVKLMMEDLLNGNPITVEMDEQIVFNQLENEENAIWSMLLASGYLRAEHWEFQSETGACLYTLTLTNREVTSMFRKMIKNWFQKSSANYNEFIDALLNGDLKAMNHYMNDIALTTFSFFDTGNHPSGKNEPERFYHGFVLGLVVELRGQYEVLSNRESGYGRYDIMLRPVKKEAPAYILEFKVHDKEDEQTLQDTVASAKKQIEDKNYQAELINLGIPPEQIRKYGFAFEGKRVLIG